MAILYNSNYDETLPFSDVCFQVGLSTGVEQTITVPGPSTTNYQALFSYNCTSNVYVRKNGIPTSPAGGTVGEEQYNEFKPKKRYVRGGDVIHLISPDSGTTYAGVSLRQLNQT
jgi:hypothetical protein